MVGLSSCIVEAFLGIGRAEAVVVVIVIVEDIVIVAVLVPWSCSQHPGKEMGRVETCLRPRTLFGVEASPRWWSEYRPDQGGASTVSHSSKGGA